MKHQTGGAQQHINKTNVESFSIVLPSKDVIQEYVEIVSLFLSRISNNCFEFLKLEQLRNSLLHKLMSVELDVYDV